MKRLIWLAIPFAFGIVANVAHAAPAGQPAGLRDAARAAAPVEVAYRQTVAKWRADAARRRTALKRQRRAR